MPKKYQNGKLMVRRDVARPYWFIQVTTPRLNPETGKREPHRGQERLGFLDEISRKRAMELRAVTLERVNQHRTIAQAEAKFGDVTRRFVAIRVPQLGVATQAKYKLQIKNHLDPFFGEMKLSEIDRQTIEGFLVAKKDTLGWWSRIDLKGVLSAIFTAAKDWKLFEGDNPTQDVRIGRKTLVREKRLLTAEQLRLVLAALDEECRFLVRLLFGLGLNISEALGLKWGDVDLEAGTVTIRRRWYRGDLSDDGVLKSDNRGAEMVLGSALVDDLKRRGPRAASSFIFIGEGKLPPDDRDLLRERFRPVVKRLGLYYVGFGWHAFRRQNITWRQTVGGATPLEAQRAARHGSLDMTLLYTLSDPARERSQVDLMFDRLMEAPEGKPQ